MALYQKVKAGKYDDLNYGWFGTVMSYSRSLKELCEELKEKVITGKMLSENDIKSLKEAFDKLNSMYRTELGWVGKEITTLPGYRLKCAIENQINKFNEEYKAYSKEKMGCDLFLQMRLENIEYLAGQLRSETEKARKEKAETAKR